MERVLQYLGQLSDGTRWETCRASLRQRIADGVPHVSQADTESLATLPCSYVVVKAEDTHLPRK